MGKNKKKSDSAKNNSAQNAQNNMSYATDKKDQNASDCGNNHAENKNESNCR